MAKFLFIALLGLAIWLQLNGGHFLPRNAPALSLSGQEKVVLLATEWCGYCAKTRRFFAENHIRYQELDVEHSEAGRQAYERLGGGTIPLIVINDAKLIRGYDPEAIIEALGPNP